MKLIRKELCYKTVLPGYVGADDSVCFLDIETDGLSHSRNKIVLIGLFFLRKGRQEIVQIFSDSHGDEAELLRCFCRCIEDVSIVYTYNGSTFDIPFISKKLAANKIMDSLTTKPHIDLIKTIRSNKKDLGLSDCKLKTVERHIGIHREDTISGKDSILLYKEYMKSKSPAIEKTILKHNFEDILYLPQILEFEDSLRGENNLVINISERNVLVEISTLKLKENLIYLKGKSNRLSLDRQEFGRSYSISWAAEEGSLELTLTSNKCMLQNGESASYFDLEDDGLNMYDPDFQSLETLDLNIPRNIVLLEREKEPIYRNVKFVVSQILRKSK